MFVCFTIICKSFILDGTLQDKRGLNASLHHITVALMVNSFIIYHIQLYRIFVYYFIKRHNN